MFKNENSFSNIQMYSVIYQSDQSLKASQPAIICLRKEKTR